MKYYLIAGEASGDLHASKLMRELKKLDSQAMFRCWGGDLMEKQGGQLVRHYRELSFMGFLEVLINIRTILSNLAFCKKDIQSFQPDVLILIDYPGFNLRIAKFAHAAGIRVFYYISPQLWAWRSSRVKTIRKCVERMFVILPFEEDFYKKYNYKVDFVGHPLLDEIQERRDFTPKKDFFARYGLDEKKPVITLLPGSRKQEITKILKMMLTVIPDFPEYQFTIAGAPSVSPDFYSALIHGLPVRGLSGATYELLHHSVAALVTSGTATLETALLRIPEVVCYKGSYLSYRLARIVVDVKFISLVNLVMDKEVVKELIQDDLNRDNLLGELRRILPDGEPRRFILEGYNQLEDNLGGSGASGKTAQLMIQYLQKKSVI